MGRVLFSIWAFLFGVCLLIWYAIDGWIGVLKAVIAMVGLGLCIAGLLKMRQARKPAPTLIEQHEGFDAWHQALCSKTRQKFSVEEAYAMWQRKLYEHPDLVLLLSPALPVESEEESA